MKKGHSMGVGTNLKWYNLKSALLIRTSNDYTWK
jgi:hypothetical protein